MNQEGRGIEQQRMRQKHAEGNRKRRLQVLNHPERGNTICTKDKDRDIKKEIKKQGHEMVGQILKSE